MRRPTPTHRPWPFTSSRRNGGETAAPSKPTRRWLRKATLALILIGILGIAYALIPASVLEQAAQIGRWVLVIGILIGAVLLFAAMFLVVAWLKSMKPASPYGAALPYGVKRLPSLAKR